jgi:hypothetical protein
LAIQDALARIDTAVEKVFADEHNSKEKKEIEEK